MRKRFFRKRMLPFLLALACLPLLPASARQEWPESCGVAITLADSDLAAWPEIKDLEFSVHLYKVGDVSESFAVTPLPEFAEVSDSSGGTLAGLVPESPSATLLELSLALQELVTAEGSTLKPAYDLTVAGGKAGLESAAIGLYLLTVDRLEAGVYGYTSNPVLMWLPQVVGVVGGHYSFTDGSAVIKLQREDLYGNLVIEKQITGLDEQYPQAAAVFSVYGTLEDKSGVETVVIDTVKTIGFSGVGVSTAEFENLPAGAKVTVEEIYCPGFHLTGGSKAQTVVIKGSETVTVAFTNAPGTPRRFSMVENCYEYKAESDQAYVFGRRSFYKNGVLVDEETNPA